MKKIIVLIIVSFFLAGCVSNPSYVGSSAAMGAAIGALGGAALSEKGGGRRSDATLRGALGGLAGGLLYGISQDQAQQRARAQAYADAQGTTHQRYEEVWENGRVVHRREVTNSSRTYGGYSGGYPRGK